MTDNDEQVEREVLLTVIREVPAWPVMALDGHDATPNEHEAGLVADAILAAGFHLTPEPDPDVLEASAGALYEHYRTPGDSAAWGGLRSRELREPYYRAARAVIAAMTPEPGAVRGYWDHWHEPEHPTTPTPRTVETEGWAFPNERGRSHYFRAGLSLCGRHTRGSLAVAGNLEEGEGDDCATCSRIGAKEVAAWYAAHPDKSYAGAHDDGTVRGRGSTTDAALTPTKEES